MERLRASLRAAAGAVRRVARYLAGLEWTERRQHVCLFCNPANFRKIAHQDEHTIAFENARLGGKLHWLLIPRIHIRDVEALTGEHVRLRKDPFLFRVRAGLPNGDLVERLHHVKRKLLDEHCPGISPSSVHSGYHRGRRLMVGSIFWPDIVSVHHLHLHVIVEPRPVLRIFKYPLWLPLMWKSDEAVLREVRRKEEMESIELRKKR
ncbi:histidine triad-like motif-containing protein [Neofusicoccum parvum]|nr:histidine triad-like motif-containing protein [Neofusicoccum parvum]